MKKLHFIFLFACCTFQLFGQIKSKNTNDNTSIHLRVYEKARILGDINTAISSLNYLLIEDPKKYRLYADTLVYIYQNTGNYIQCITLTNDLLNSNPDKESLLAIKANCLKQVGKTSESAELFSKLYSKTNLFWYGLELLQLQLGLQRLAECDATASQLISQEIPIDAKITVPKLDNKSTQDIKIKAFVYYVQGLAHNSKKDFEEAKSKIQKALEIEPTFELANNALSTLLNQDNAKK